MDKLELRKKSLAALLLASVSLVMLPGCSSTEEAPATDGGGVPTGDKGIPCDLDPLQTGCEDYRPDL
jgi:hypothetical protein